MWPRCSPWLAVLFFQENLDKQKDLSGSNDSLAENTKVGGTCLMVLTVFLLLLFCLSQWLQRHLTIVKFKKRCNIENLTDETLFQEKGGALTAIFKKSLKRSESPPSEEVSCALLVFISWYPLSHKKTNLVVLNYWKSHYNHVTDPHFFFNLFSGDIRRWALR